MKSIKSEKIAELIEEIRISLTLTMWNSKTNSNCIKMFFKIKDRVEFRVYDHILRKMERIFTDTRKS